MHGLATPTAILTPCWPLSAIPFLPPVQADEGTDLIDFPGLGRVTVRVALPRMGGTMAAVSLKSLGKKEVSPRDRKKQEKQVDDDKKKKLADTAEEDHRVQ